MGRPLSSLRQGAKTRLLVERAVFGLHFPRGHAMFVSLEDVAASGELPPQLSDLIASLVLKSPSLPENSRR